MLPWKLFTASERPNREEKLPIQEGMTPVRLLAPSSRIDNFVKELSWCGISPVKLFSATANTVR
uniref:Uncharacterized protein n=1 Tax=Rhizophora mucronata TaxID=61149 RepID=A0A2P2Q3Z8_RHIMU